MAVVARLRRAHLQAMVEHALREAPIECCGMLGKRDGVIAGVYPAKNAEASPFRFSIDAREQLRIEAEMEAAGHELAGFYHSHTGSEARPSPTDIRMMAPLFGPPYVHFVIGVADREHPEVRVFTIEGDRAVEHEYELLD
ncbi:MAG: M67 family metallopeptidase [Chloroflexota bacterium]|jgi:proteasome lid subunit RPN8/RPN11|nr:M67 family metallopeptidase [Dehalococcoidia bacterium]MDW8046480.1 M67 family metallopeptidase [Chloroflexota bacterium]